MASTQSRLLRALSGTRTETNGVISYATATDLLVMDLTRKMIEADYQERNFVKGTEGAQGDDVDNLHAGVDFSLEAGMTGTAGELPAYGDILKACGLSDTSTSTTASLSPTPMASDLAEIAFEMRDADRRQVIEKARGTLEFSAENGKKPMFMTKFLGTYDAATVPSAVTPDFTSWPTALSCTTANMNAVTIGGISVCCQSLTLSDGRTPTRNTYMNCDETNIRARKVTGKMVIELPDAATLDMLTLATSAAKQALVWELGKTGSPQLKLAAPAVQFKFAGEQDIDGDIGMAFDLIFTADQGDDEFAFTWTGV